MKIAFSFGQIKCLFDIFSLLDLFLLLLSNLLRNLPPDPLCLFFDSSSRHPHLGTGVGDDDRPHLRREQQDEAGQDDKLQGEDAPVLLHGHADLHPLGYVGQGGGHLRAIDGHELAPERNGILFSKFENRKMLAKFTGKLPKHRDQFSTSFFPTQSS